MGLRGCTARGGPRKVFFLGLWRVLGWGCRGGFCCVSICLLCGLTFGVARAWNHHGNGTEFICGEHVGKERICLKQVWERRPSLGLSWGGERSQGGSTAPIPWNCTNQEGFSGSLVSPQRTGWPPKHCGGCDPEVTKGTRWSS